MKTRTIIFAVLALSAFVGCQPRQPAVVLTYAADLTRLPAGASPDPSTVAGVLNDRLGPLGRARPVDNEQVAVEIFHVPDSAELGDLKRRIESIGVLEFRITAQPARTEIRPIIAAAMQLPADETDVALAGETKAEWVDYSAAEFGGPNAPDDRIVKRTANGRPQALVLMDQWNVSGAFLSSAGRASDERNGPAVNFTLNPEGAMRFSQLTATNLPNQAIGQYRNLGIILDKQLLSAPRIQSVISDRGQISGGAFTSSEIDNIVAVLNAGKLAYAIKLVSEKRSNPENTPSLLLSPVWVVMAAGVLLLLIVAAATLFLKTR